METKHTAGPWACDERTVYSMQGHQPHVCSCESIADGKLIAAAPEMLDELEINQRMIEHVRECAEWLKANYKDVPEGQSIDTWIENLLRPVNARYAANEKIITKATHP